MPAFDVAGARKAGYDDKEILSYVAGEENPDLIPGTDAEKIRLLLARSGKHMLDVEYLSPTQLEPMQEVQFQDWAKRNKVRLEPGWNEDYDMRGLWKSNPGAALDPQGQWPDTYKLPNHPTFSSQSIYALPELPAPKLPQGLSGSPDSVPGSEPLNLLGPISAPSPLKGVTPQGQPRRQMTPEEIAVLGVEPGITPTLPPLNAADLAMLALSGPVESAGLPPTLLQMVRYKRPGVSTLAQEAAEAYHVTPRVDPIGAKNTVFHATDPESLGSILKAGEIVPDPHRLERTGMPNWKSFLDLKQLDAGKRVPQDVLDKFVQEGMEKYPDKLKRVAADYYGITADDPDIWRAVENWRNPPAGVGRTGQDLYRALGYFDPDEVPKVLGNLGYRVPSPSLGRGVSVSRVPRVASKGTKAVSFVIDESKMPRAIPFTESGYRKTRPATVGPSWTGADKERNPVFEFENRTLDQPIPMSAVREMWVDKSAIGSDPLSWGLGAERPQDIVERMRRLAQEYGIPLREFETGRQMHAGRATLSDLAKKKRK